LTLKTFVVILHHLLGLKARSTGQSQLPENEEPRDTKTVWEPTLKVGIYDSSVPVHNNK
jgi:hypothetical protein